MVTFYDGLWYARIIWRLDSWGVWFTPAAPTAFSVFLAANMLSSLSIWHSLILFLARPLPRLRLHHTFPLCPILLSLCPRSLHSAGATIGRFVCARSLIFGRALTKCAWVVPSCCNVLDRPISACSSRFLIRFSGLRPASLCGASHRSLIPHARHAIGVLFWLRLHQHFPPPPSLD